MARIRHEEFVSFVLDGKTKKINGNLSMKGNDVYSYYTKIGEVDRTNKVIRVNDGDFRRSKTTNNHLSAITTGFKFLPESGWRLEYVARF